MLKEKEKKLNYFDLLEKFIRDSKKGMRIQKNGKRMTLESIKNYEYANELL